MLTIGKVLKIDLLNVVFLIPTTVSDSFMHAREKERGFEWKMKRAFPHFEAC